jgi:DNA polymerase-1
MSNLVILDCNFLCHRVWHSMDMKLSHGEIPTAVTFGFLKDFCRIAEFRRGSEFAFTWDHGRILRKDLQASYKSDRTIPVLNEMDIRDKRAFLDQVDTLKKEVIRDLGFSNNFYEDGYEADDLIASLAIRRSKDTEVEIVSADKDLWQLINSMVKCHNPITKKDMTLQTFFAEYGILPDQWYKVKAIAGCKTDKVPGAEKVGDITAVKFLKGALPKTTKAYAACLRHTLPEEKGGTGGYRHNVKMVKLPFAGTPEPQMRPDATSKEKWKEVLTRYGITSLPYPF